MEKQSPDSSAEPDASVFLDVIGVAQTVFFEIADFCFPAARYGYAACRKRDASTGPITDELHAKKSTNITTAGKRRRFVRFYKLGARSAPFLPHDRANGRPLRLRAGRSFSMLRVTIKIIQIVVAVQQRSFTASDRP